MAFLVRRPFAFIIIAIVCVVLIIQLSGSFNKKPIEIVAVEIIPTLKDHQISMMKNTTLTVIIKNKGASLHSVEYRIVGTFASEDLLFYDSITGTLLPSPVWTGSNYTITYPVTRNLNVQEEWGVSVIIKGLDPKGDSATYTIFVEVLADGALSERKTIQLKVVR